VVTSIGSAAPAQTSTVALKKTQQEEQAAVATQVEAAAPDDSAGTGETETETVSALSSATARVGDQLAAQADASRMERARPVGGGGAAATSETGSTDYIAEADTNSDKKVSDEERAAYEKKLEQQAQDKSGAVQKAYGLAEESAPAVSATA